MLLGPCSMQVSESAFEFMVKRATDSHIVVRKGVAEARRTKIEAMNPQKVHTTVPQAIAFLLAGREVDTPTGMQRKAHPEHAHLRLLQFLAVANLERQQRLWPCSLQIQAKSSDCKLARRAILPAA